MRNHLLATVAISLLASGGFAYAQTAADKHGAGSDSTLQHAAPAETGAARSAADSDRADKNSGKDLKAGSLGDTGRLDRSNSSPKNAANEPGANLKAPSENRADLGGRPRGAEGASPERHAATKADADAGAAKGAGTDLKSTADVKSGKGAVGTNGSARAAASNERNGSAEQRQASDRKGGASETRQAEERGGSEHSAGQPDRGAQMSRQDQAKIVDTIRSQHVTNIRRADFDLRVGVAVPNHYSFHPLPVEIVQVYPEFRGDEYLLVDDEIVVVEPRSHRIVRTIDVYRTAAMDQPSRDCR